MRTALFFVLVKLKSLTKVIKPFLIILIVICNYLKKKNVNSLLSSLYKFRNHIHKQLFYRGLDWKY
jgi:uncharacterized membrane protein